LGFLNDSDVEWLASIARRYDDDADEILIRPGEPSETMFILIDPPG